MKLYKIVSGIGAFLYTTLGLLTIGSIINSTIGWYTNDRLVTIESTEVLKLDPLNKLSTPMELIKAFDGRRKTQRSSERVRARTI